MFKTGINIQHPTPRQIKTSLEQRQRSKINKLQDFAEQQVNPSYSLVRHKPVTNHKKSIFSISVEDPDQFRPETTNNIFKRVQMNRSMPRSEYETIVSAEDELQTTFNGELSHYLRRKFRVMAHQKHQQQNPCLKEQNNTTLFSTIQNPQLEKNIIHEAYRSPRKISHFCNMLSKEANSIENRIHQNTPANTAFVINARQKISRLIYLKRQEQHKYEQLKQKIHQKSVKKDHEKSPNGYLFLTERSKGSSYTTIADEKWDQEWREVNEKEAKRYKNRLMFKTQQKFKLKVHGSRTIEYA